MVLRSGGNTAGPAWWGRPSGDGGADGHDDYDDDDDVGGHAGGIILVFNL